MLIASAMLVFVAMLTKTLRCFIFALVGFYPFTPVFSGLFDRTPSCEKSAKKLLGSGYKYSANRILVSDDAQHLAVFVEFNTLKKVKSGFYARENITLKLLRYRREGEHYTLVSEQGVCEKYIDFQHLQALMDKDRNVYTYNRKANTFSVWPEDPALKITNNPVTGANLSSSTIAIDRASGLIYASHDKHIVRQSKPGDFAFEEWLRFDDYFDASKSWNPFRINVAENRLWVSMVISDNEDIYAPNVHEYWVFDTEGTLLNKQPAKDAYTRFHPGSPAIGLDLDLLRQKRKRNEPPGPPLISLKYIDAVSGKAAEIVRFSGEKSDLSLSGTSFSSDGTLYTVYNLYQDEAQAVLHLIRYHPSSGRSETLLPLVSGVPGAIHIARPTVTR
ncbi:hypothetical protein MNBD_GAMMA15-833 [hydrothermal vent metagenome]|uniref:Uncharacterized protein n=1 Tax=hydrothermal vent metagenome TaxID=652676 RepID=A0A3B0YD85_9ZZZZ